MRQLGRRRAGLGLLLPNGGGTPPTGGRGRGAVGAAAPEAAIASRAVAST